MMTCGLCPTGAGVKSRVAGISRYLKCGPWVLALTGYCAIPLHSGGLRANLPRTTAPCGDPETTRGHRVIDTLRHIQTELERRPHLHRLGALFSETVMLKIDGDEFYLVFEKGHITRVVEGPSKRTPYRFGFVTDAAALAEFWRATPAPGFHDIFAMVKIGRAEILGDMLLLVKNLRFFKEVIALPRAAKEGAQ